jgi:hypothetical protein
MFKSKLEKCTFNFTQIIKSAKAEESKYGKIIYISSIHNHPQKAIEAIYPRQNYSILPPSTTDLALSLYLKDISFGVNYAVDVNNIWKFSFNLMQSNDFIKKAAVIDASENERAKDLYGNAQKYIDTVNKNGGYISKVNIGIL